MRKATLYIAGPMPATILFAPLTLALSFQPTLSRRIFAVPFLTLGTTDSLMVLFTLAVVVIILLDTLCSARHIAGTTTEANL